jgi:hypothetical protein
MAAMTLDTARTPFDMTMLTHTRGPLDRAAYSSQRRDTVAARRSAAPLTTIKRFGMWALTVVAAGSAIAATIALKAVLFLWVFHYY